jgi:hypothetical protein
MTNPYTSLTPRPGTADPLSGVPAVPADGGVSNPLGPQRSVPATPGAQNPAATNPLPNSSPLPDAGEATVTGLAKASSRLGSAKYLLNALAHPPTDRIARVAGRSNGGERLSGPARDQLEPSMLGCANATTAVLKPESRPRVACPRTLIGPTGSSRLITPNEAFADGDPMRRLYVSGTADCRHHLRGRRGRRKSSGVL